MSDPFAWSVIGATVVLGVLSAFAIIRANRRKAYLRWAWPVRWVWFGLCGVLVALGSAILVNNYVDDWGAPAASWFLLAPAAYGLYLALPTARQASPPESPRSDSKPQ